MNAAISSPLFGDGKFTYQLDEPWSRLTDDWPDAEVNGVAVDRDDNVYALHTNQQVVHVFSANGGLLRSWKVTGSEGKSVPTALEIKAGGAGPQIPARFTYPHSLTIAPDGSVFIPDNVENVVRKFTPDGVLVMTIGQVGLGSDTGANKDLGGVVPVLRGARPFNGPANVAVAADGGVYVADGYRNARIHHLSPDGGLRDSWGAPGAGPGEFRLPHSVALTDDEMIVADRENNRLAFFGYDGKYRREWGGFTRPCDIAIDRDGLIYLVELGPYATFWTFVDDEASAAPSRCTILSPEGEVLARWGTRNAAEPGSFFTPHCIAVDSVGSIYVGETNYTIEQGRGEGPSGGRALQKFVRI